MSGHSKWETTKHQKARVDKKRSGIFTKMAKLLMVAARDGADPDINFKLRLAIDKAKAVNMPKDNIERAVKKGAGLSESEQYWDVLYEAYAPGGIALIVEATTDNKNRTASNVRAIINKYGGSLGASNSVLYMFKRTGVIIINIKEDVDVEELMLDLIEEGANDVEIGSENNLVIYTSLEKFLDLKKYLENNSYEIIDSELEYLSDNEIEVDVEKVEKIQKMIDILERDDDVNKVFTNAKY